tara:strand:- start:167 stop:463 length:297 start_codon:yes stop_codon:yes gene_type:complete
MSDYIEISDDDEVYEKLINMWDHHENGIDERTWVVARILLKEIYRETEDDKERTVAIFKKALENYRSSAYIYSRLSDELAELEEEEGDWSVEDEEDES